MDWKDELPDDIKSDPSLASIQDVAGLAKSYINAQTLVGKKGVILPGENATEDDWNQFYGAIGRPETPDKYEIAKPSELPEGFPYVEDIEKNFKDVAHKMGLTPNQVKGLYDWYMKMDVDLFQTAQNHLKQQGESLEAELRKEWGMAYDQKAELAKRAAKQFADEDTLTQLEGALGAPGMVKLFAKIGEAMGEDKMIGGGGGSGTALTPDQARQEIAKIMGDPKHSYHLGDHPEHKIAVDNMAKLFQQAYPNA